MFQEFPYTNFHQLNLDWIVKIAKDFLDQYTHIQEVIQTGLDDLSESRETGLEELNQKTLDGLADLQEKYDTLNGLLQAWYDTHSADIAGQLAQAIIDFNTAAEAKSQALLDSWPADYSELVTEYHNLKSALESKLLNLCAVNVCGEEMTSDSYHGIDVKKNGNKVELNGTATGPIRIKLSNNMDVQTYAQEAWKSEYMNLVPGKKYLLLIAIVSGSITGGIYFNSIRSDASVEKYIQIKSTDTIVENTVLMSEAFTASESNQAYINTYFSADTAFDHFVFQINYICIDDLREIIGIQEDIDPLTEKVEDAKTTTYNYADAIESNSDLDSYTTPGNYFIDTFNIAETVSHIPVTTNGMLTVYSIRSNEIIQEYRTLNNVYTRMKIASNSWSEWLELLNGANFPVDENENYKRKQCNFINAKFSRNGILFDTTKAIHIEKLNDGTRVFFDKTRYALTYMVVNPQDLGELLIQNTGWYTSGEMTIDTEGLETYTVIVQVKDATSTDNFVDVSNANKYIAILERKKIVDLIIFIGQSNMAGRGSTSTEFPDGYPDLIPCAGLEFRAISDNTRLYPVSEPFGLNENVNGKIDDGPAKKTGGPATAFINAYYTETGMQVVGVSASEGGTSIDEWASGSAKLTDAIQRLTDAVTYLTTNGYQIRHKYMLWCQGESDTRVGITPEQHKQYFEGILADMKTAGIEKCFMIRIGEYNGTAYDYSDIINIQTQIAQNNIDVIMATTVLAGYKEKGMMNDNFHYYQQAYNEFGMFAGVNAAVYVNTGKEPTMYDPKNENLYYCHKN